MKKIILLLGIICISCTPTNKLYIIDMKLKNGREITRHYDLPDSVNIYIKERKGKYFLVYANGCYPIMLKKNVETFKIK